MANDRFATEVATQVAAVVIHTLRNEGLVINVAPSRATNIDSRISPKLLRIGEVAVMLARTEKAVRRLIDKGELNVVRHRRSIRIAVKDVMDFIKKCRTKTSTKGGENKWDGLVVRMTKTKP